MNRPNFLSTLTVVTQREFKHAFWTRSTLITIITVSIIMLAALIVPNLVSGNNTEQRIAVTGISASDFNHFQQAAGGSQIELEYVTDPALPEDADALWVVGTEDQQGQLQIKKASQESDLLQAVNAIRLNLIDAIQPPGPLGTVTVTVQEDDRDQNELLIIAYFVVIVGFNLVVSNASIVAQRCIEEKGNRVIDILIPRFNLQGFLAGKVCGTGLAGVAQLIVLGVIATALLSITDNGQWVEKVLEVLPHAIIWYMLGFLFFGFLYAGLGSLLRSPTEGAALQAPLQMLNLGLFVVAIFGLQDPTASWIQWLVAIPPFSLVLGPLVSVVSGWTLTLALALLLTSLAIVVLSFLGVRLYRWGIVNDDWRKLFQRKYSESHKPQNNQKEDIRV